MAALMKPPAQPTGQAPEPEPEPEADPAESDDDSWDYLLSGDEALACQSSDRQTTASSAPSNPPTLAPSLHRLAQLEAETPWAETTLLELQPGGRSRDNNRSTELRIWSKPATLDPEVGGWVSGWVLG